MVNQRNFFARECPCLYLSGQFWTLIKSILEPLQTPESSEGSEDEGETPLKGKPEYAKPEGGEQKMLEVLKATVPSAPLGRTNFLYLRFFLLS